MITNKKTSAARGMQALTTPIFGGTKEGVDPDGQYHKDLAMLEAYNRQLAIKQVQDVRSRRRAGDDRGLTRRRRRSPRPQW